MAARRSDGDLADGGRAMRLRVLRRTGMVAADIYAAYRARFGVDVRTPLADRRLVEFCVAVPEEQYMTNGQRRLLIRRAMAGRLPQRHAGRTDSEVFRRRPGSRRMSAERTALLTELEAFEADDLTSRILDLPRMRTLLEQWPRERPLETARRGPVPRPTGHGVGYRTLSALGPGELTEIDFRQNLYPEH